MGGSRRPPPGADRCFVWLKDESGMLFGREVDGRGETREQAARAWLALVRHPIAKQLLHEESVLKVRADGRETEMALATLREWLEMQSGSPREMSLKVDLRVALGLTSAP